MIPLWLKRLLRPLIPDRVMARHRLRQHSHQARVNVDVLVADKRDRGSWLRCTPDTYRVGLIARAARRFDGASGSVRFGSRSDASVASSFLTGTDAVVVAGAETPSLVARRRSEAVVQPLALVMGADVAADIVARPEDDLAGLYRRLGDAGYRIRLIPRRVPRVDPGRRDQIGVPAVVMLGAVPMHDVGGGSRTTQIALELLRRGFHVIYVSLFGTQESTDLGIRFIHPRLEQYRADEFDVGSVLRRTDDGIAILEVPAAQLVQLWRQLGSAGWRTVYDVIDRWADPALGGEWYRESLEREAIAAADRITVSAVDLASLVADLGGESAVVIANGVNRMIFGRAPGPTPDDMPAGSPVLGYHGSLYGDWFSWSDLDAVARRFPAAAVVVIGDAPQGRPPLAPNITFLGLKPQSVLPDYVARFDVGLIPFAVTATTHAVSPLKVFEYLASGVRVAAPPLRSLQGLDGVDTAEVLADAVVTALGRPRPDRERMLREHSWEARVGELLSALDVADPGGSDPARLAIRPVMHYARQARRL